MQRQSSRLQHKGINATDSDRLSISSSECSTLSDAVESIRNNDKKDRSVTRRDEQWKEYCRAERRAIKLWKWKYREIQELYGKSQVTSTDTATKPSTNSVRDAEEKSIREELIGLQNQFFLHKVNFAVQHH